MQLLGHLLKTRILLAVYLSLILLFLVLTNSVSAAPQTFVVTNTNDSGVGSLRQAINDSNANYNPSDTDTINFNIPGNNVHTITLESELPGLNEPTIIDGYSQTGAQENTISSPGNLNSVIKIEINGQNLEGLSTGINVYNTGGGSTVKGLSVYGFQTGILVGSENLAYIYGNYIGVNANGDQSLGNKEIGLTLQGKAYVGGANPNDRNLISGNKTSNLMVFSAIPFGTNSAEGSRIQGNLIGPSKNGETPNNFSPGTGIVTQGDVTGVLIGGTSSSQANVIKGVSGAGIAIGELYAQAIDFRLTSNKVAVIGNRISDIRVFNFPNFGTSNMGIDILTFVDTDNPPDGQPNDFSGRGPQPNDDEDSDGGPNNLINYPVLKSAQQSGNQLSIKYDLDATDSPSNRYRIEFFANSERSIFGFGPGEMLIGSDPSVEPGTDKTVTLTVDENVVGKALSATTTAIDASTDSGFGSTSELSQNISIGSGENFDADGVSDAIEDGAPNNGDGNNDGIPDKLQPTVTSFISSGVNGKSTYITLVTSGCSENGRVSSVSQDSIQIKDNGYKYPYGLTDFKLYCNKGSEVSVEMYVHTRENPEKYMPRKFNISSEEFYNMPGSSLTSEVLGSSTALKLAYSIKDGGDLDDDGDENGIIVDPVGLATESSLITPGQLVRTGFTTVIPALIALSIIGASIYTYVDYRKHRKPLEEVDRELNTTIAKQYTFWHHLKVVTIPLAKYRITIRLEKKATLGKSGLFDK